MHPDSHGVNLRIYYNGKFEVKNGKTEYVGGDLNLQYAVSINKINLEFLRNVSRNLMGDDVEMWYRSPGFNLTDGKRMVFSDYDVVNLLKSKDKHSMVCLYLIHPSLSLYAILPQNLKPPTTKLLNMVPISSQIKAFPSPFKKPTEKLNNTAPKKVVPSPNPNALILRRSPRKTAASSVTEIKAQPSNFVVFREKLPIKRHLHFGESGGGDLLGRLEICEKNEQLSQEKKGNKKADAKAVVGTKCRNKKRVSQEGKKKSGKKALSRRFIRGEGLRQKNIVSEELDDEEEFEYSDSEESNFGISDIEWQVGDEDNNVVEELFNDNKRNSILESVEHSLGLNTSNHQQKAEASQSVPQHIWGIDELEVNVDAEKEYESDDLRSLQGSDDEVDLYPTFNPGLEFKKPIVLSQGLKFANVQLFRTALIRHSVENGYEFYYSHNEAGRVNAYCRFRCKCPWNSKRSRFPKCKCEVKNECAFRVYGVKLDDEDTFQIKTLNLKHKCPMSKYNRKVSSEYLANRYLEFWRTNVDWKLKHFQEHVLKELNVHVTYSKCWLARSRAKLVIYGNGRDQYARIWDYAVALKKYNQGSSAFVVCDNIERPPVIFKRIYICLEACKKGFVEGCRPIIGVDGCHLKGAYPGMCLVAVGKDGNNNIYPVAWAVVEVENADTWKWFLELLVGDIGSDEGEGLTFMSDRQKGLIDALKYVVPKSEIRYCVRHIWANFKLSFGGQLFKENFWKTARATTKAEFTSQMEEIKSLSTEAWAYLDAIPAKHWSRHAFATQSKSNMLLNNLCETFNAVLKDARDKPILTQMEWMRRYVMKRHCEKRDGVSKYDDILMPYATKYLKWAGDESRYAKVSAASDVKFEVDLHGRSWSVNLKERTCDCYHWDLTGLPCPHVMGVILDQRMHVPYFVDEAYTKKKYFKAYEPVVSPMPGVQQWERSGLPEPLPPPIRKMPGRPKSKKRRREAGEEENKYVKRPKRSNKCSNCGKPGHSKRTCKNPSAPPKTRDVGGRPESNSDWAKEGRMNAARRKALKATYAAAHQPASNSQASASSYLPNEVPTQSSMVIPAWAKE